MVAGVIHRQAKGALHRFRPARVELDLVHALGSDPRDLVDQLGARRAGERSDGHLVELLVQRFGVGGMAMAEAVDADPADEVDVAVAVDVFDHRSLRALDRDAGAERKPLQPRREMTLLVLHQFARAGPGNFRPDMSGLQRHSLPFRSRSGLVDSRPAPPMGGRVSHMWRGLVRGTRGAASRAWWRG